MAPDAPAATPKYRALEKWGSSLEGDWRLTLYGALGGAAFFFVIWATAAYAFTGDLTGPDGTRGMLLPGAALFALLWALFTLFGVIGWPRVFLCTLMGHLLGYLMMVANLLIASINAYEPLQAVVTLFGFTAIGFLVGVGLEVLVATSRYLHQA